MGGAQLAESEETQNTIVLEARLAWTQARNMRRVRLEPEQNEYATSDPDYVLPPISSYNSHTFSWHRQARRDLLVGEMTNWCVRVEAHSIIVQVSFAPSDGTGSA